ncbi:hypothetical protein FA95DRAFT_739476 [Auriscalpium vulgare]|uniref:Uncharacterized protein n=1 Tax=Auriscalpium vulgare TaxID=40419 RepID=A0ACB8SAP6_9AGAM|nr:hypothetical protein FA95DRAFT_739476 [Auriscalpium vulgare]
MRTSSATPAKRQWKACGTSVSIALVRFPLVSTLFCLTAPTDYDLCTSCLDAPTRTHPREHQFFAIEEPGGVYVHTVFSSNDPSQEELATQVRNVQDLVASQVRTAIDAAAAAIQAGERAVAANENATREAREAMGASLGALHPPHVPFYPPPPPPVVPSSQAPVVQAVPALVAHNATCDMCDSRIEGDRYKCTDCPDYDTCSSCFTLVPSQHPSHTFVRLSVADLLIQPAPSRLLSAHPKYADSPTHHATCDACRRSIRGVRFKCMHPACADFDLCADCESLPLAVHPREHPLLKIRTPGGYVPRVWRYCAGSEADVLREVAREEVEKKREKESQFEEVLKKMDQEDQVPAAQQLEQADADKQESAPLVVDDVLMRLTRMFSEQTDPSTPLPLPAFGQTHTTDDQRLHCQTHTTDDQRQNNTPTPRPAHVSPPPPVSVQMRPSVSYGVPIPVPVSIPAFPTPVVRPVSVSSSPPTTQSVAPMTFPAAQSSPPPRNPFLGVFAGPPQIPPFASVFPPEPRHTFPPATVRTPTLPPPPPSWLDMVRSPPQSPSRPVAPAAVTPPFIASPPPQLSLDLAPFEAPELEEEVQMPGQYDPLPIMVRRWSPEPLIQFEDKPVKVQASDNDNGEDADTRETSTLRDDASESDMSTLPRVRPTDFNELFDLAAQFRHLLELPSVPKHIPQSTANATVESEGDVASVVTPTELTSTVEGQESSKVPSQSAASTQGLEAASSTRGLPAPKAPFVQSKPNSIQSLIDTLRITSPRALEEILSGASVSSSTPEAAEADALLRATFVEDNNIPDGQIFPPGAEFVKSWRMRNDGLGAWPAGTEVVYVAGDKLMLDKRERFSVGSVAPGEEVDVWTGELKAPDVPGKYISYWRLNDPGRGRFGHSIWIDITVAEASNVQRTDDSDSSLAASSVIMPAQPASSVAAESAPAAQPDEATTAPLSPALTQVSTTSSVSLIDMPSDASDEESDVFEDSRSNVGSSPMANANLSPDIEYVVLYDSSDEE